MFTTGSKLFLGATVAVDRRRHRRTASATGGAAGWLGVIGLLSAAVVFAFLVRRQLLRPRRQRVGDADERRDRRRRPRSRRSGAACGRARRGRLSARSPSAPSVQAGRVQGRRRRAAGRWRRVDGPGWSERASADRRYNADVRKRMLHPARVPGARRGRPRRDHLLVLADHAVDRQERRPGGLRHRRRTRRWSAGSCSPRKPSLKQGVVAGRVRDRRARPGQHRRGDGHRRPAPDRGAPDDRYRQRRGLRCWPRKVGHAGRDRRQGFAGRGREGQRRHAPSCSRTASSRRYEQAVDGRQNHGHGVARQHRQRDLQEPRSREAAAHGQPGRVRGKTSTAPLVKQRPKVCTTLVRGNDGSQFLSFVLPKPSIASSQPYTFTVPGVDGAPIEIVVP